MQVCILTQEGYQVCNLLPCKQDVSPMVEGISLVVWQVILDVAEFKNEGPLLNDLVPVEVFSAVLLDQLTTLVTGVEAARYDHDK